MAPAGRVVVRGHHHHRVVVVGRRSESWEWQTGEHVQHSAASGLADFPGGDAV